MKVLMIKPPSFMVPTSLAYVLGMLDYLNVEYDVYDATFNNRDLISLISENNYSTIMSGSMTSDLPYIIEIGSKIKKHFPKIPYIVGGRVVYDLNRKMLLDNTPIDIGVFGEAETALEPLLKYLQTGETSGLNGVALYMDGKYTEIREILADFSKIDITPAYWKFEHDKYIQNKNKNMKTHPVVPSKGCTNRCAFCSQIKGRFRTRDFENIYKEVLLFKDMYQPDIFFFSSSVIFQNDDDLKTFCQGLIDRKINIKWTCNIRTDTFPDMLEIMKDAGCFKLQIGVESGDDQTLVKMNKKSNLKLLEQFISRARELGMKLYPFTMTAYEDDTEETIQSSFDYQIKNNIHFMPALTTPLPGTKLYDSQLAKGNIKDEWDYVLNMDFPIYLDDPDIKRYNYLNLTRVPDKDFYTVLYRQYRRYENSFNERLALKRPEIQYNLAEDAQKIVGKCNCGADVSFGIDHGGTFINLLHREHFCTSCTETTRLNIFGFHQLKEHKKMLTEQMAKAEKILLYGVNSNAAGSILFNHLDIPFEKVIGIAGYKPTDKEFFYDLKVLSDEEVNMIQPDMILNLETLRNGLRNDFSFKHNLANFLPDIPSELALNKLKGRKCAVWMGKPDIFDSLFSENYKDLIEPAVFIEDHREKPDIPIRFHNIEIIKPEQVNNFEFDIVIIPALKTTPTYDRIYKYLSEEAGIEKERIIGAHHLLAFGLYS